MEGKRSLLSFTMLWIFALTLLVNFGNARPNNQQDRAVDPEEDMPTPDIIQFWGYPAETHEVITADGYILTMHRIPYGKAKSNQIRPVVLFMHGLEESSSCWVINLVNQSAGFLFADAGFDVWMGNVRGNTYSNDHVKLNPKKREFWRFSWDEMVKLKCFNVNLVIFR
jgi:lysosomal acid lipase/cholesteryl ester hydrolase